MKKFLALLAAVVFSFAFLVPVSAEETNPAEKAGLVGKVTTQKGSLNMRRKADAQSAVCTEIPNGACLLVLEEGQEWCLCQWNGKTGYCSAAFLTILRDADVSLLDYRMLRQGDQGEDVLAVKQRLQDLGYIRAGSELTNVYNDILTERIILFERQVGMTEDGVASQELQAYLFSERAPQCTQVLPIVRSQVKKEENGLRKVICCCWGEGCECCNGQGWIYY